MVIKKQKLIGRQNELRIFDKMIASKESQFVAVYGRRRVGKTFLIRNSLSNKGIYIETTGRKDAPLKTQLENFAKALSKTFFNDIPIQTPSRWEDALALFDQELKKVPKKKKVILFLDELPWLATKKSGLIQALDYYWNAHWSKTSNLILVVCGSAASWMLDHLIHAKGGLHNRLTKRMLLEPFTLNETEQFLKSHSIHLSQKQILDLYMVTGGIPYYLKEVKRGRSAAQNIDELCFSKSGLLYTEFQQLFHALFDQAEVNLKIVREIAKSGNIISRENLLKKTKLPSGGTTNKRLTELSASGFIQCFIPYGKTSRNRYYRLVDEYTLFYLKWIEPIIKLGSFSGKGSYWEKLVNSPARAAWAGYAFESVCLKHTYEISKGLGLNHIPFNVGTWRFVPSKKSKAIGAQIDLLFDRGDDAITVCEIKYSDKLFTIDKPYAKSLTSKLDIFEVRTKTKKELFLAMITTTGVKHNLWSEDIVDTQVTLDALFLKE